MKVGGVRHNGHMMSQVVLSPTADGSRTLRISRIETQPVAEVSDSNKLHLGSQDLIRLASYAAQHGFEVKSFMLADSYLSPIEADEQAETSDAMVEILKLYGGNELEAAMRDDFDGVYVVGVNVIALSTGLRISVRRRGYVETSILQEAEDLIASAWQELHLS